MSRRSRVSEESFSLFPFLAVLLCTMGTLALIFVLVAQKGGDESGDAVAAEESVAEEFDPELGSDGSGSVIDAQTLATALDPARRQPKFADVDSLAPIAEPSPEDAEYERAMERTQGASLEDLENEAESLAWFLEELKTVRDKSEATLQEERARLANAEAGMEKLRAEMEAARKRYQAIQESGGEDETDSLRNKIAELDAEIAKLEEETRELREKNTDGKRSYAILPYQGKKGTFRRPIYIECCKEGVLLQPGAYRFEDFDFLLAEYPGNPFDAALRAVAQRMTATGGERNAKGEIVEPYPLLIVRPGGEEAFYAAIRALASWGDLYGYEFVEKDQQLVYPDPDPELTGIARRRAEHSRMALQAQLQKELEKMRVLEQLAQNQARGANSGAGVGTGAVGSFEGGTEGGPNVAAGGMQSRLGGGVRVGAARAPGLATGQGNSQTRTVAQNAPNGGILPGGGGGQTVGAAGLWNTPAYSGNYGQYVTGVPGAQSAAFGTATGSVPEQTTASGSAGGADQQIAQGQPVQVSGELPPELASGIGSVAANGVPAGNSTAYVPQTSATAEQSANGAVAANPNANTPAYMSMFTATGSSSGGAADVDGSKTLGNSAFVQGSNVRPEDASSDAPSSTTPDSSWQEHTRAALQERAEREGAITTRDIMKQATSGNERGIMVRCDSKWFIFPKQPGLRSDVRISRDPARGRDAVDRDLEEAITLCVRSWGSAGQNYYWAPFLKVDVVSDGEEAFKDLSDFCSRRDFGIVRVSSARPENQK